LRTNEKGGIFNHAAALGHFISELGGRMLKSLLQSIIVAVGVALLCSPGWAAPLPIFGPKQFTRSTGAPQDFTETFQNCETLAQYKLVVVNGASNGGSRVSAAWIVLNGVEIFAPRNFSQQVGRIETPIRVQQVNTLQVRIASAPVACMKRSIASSVCAGVGWGAPLPPSPACRRALVDLACSNLAATGRATQPARWTPAAQ
jgi:hypothetical protein